MAPRTKSVVEPWVERHRPKHLGQLVGNTEQVRKLAEWLRDWDDVVLRGKVKEQPAQKDEWRKFQPAPENINARAALISGPPGIGKTTTCCLVARCNPKYTLMEYNASDARSKAVIDSMNSSLAGNHTLNLSGKGLERAVIVMDECDGMAGGGDKGGMAAMINMIKTAKNPIICICNDRGDQQVKNLAAHCLDIKFRKPENLTVAKRVKSIMEGEGRKMELGTIEAVVESCGQDIRQVINHLQFFGAAAVAGTGSGKELTAMLTPFDACAKLLSGGDHGSKTMPMKNKLDLFYIDADFMPLMIQENYMRPYEKHAHGKEEDVLETCAKAAELIALGDSMSSQGSFEVGSSAAVIGSIYPAFLTAGNQPFARPNFPSWIKTRGDTNKAEKSMHEIHAKIKASTTCSCRDLVTSNYHDVLHRRLLRPLQLGGPKDCAAALMAYGLSREFFTDLAPALRKPLQLEDAYQKVDGKLKHALLQEIQSLAQVPTPLKRMREDIGRGGGTNAFTRKRAGHGQDVAADDGALGDEEAAAKKKADAKKKAKTGNWSDSRSSLNSWIPKKPQVAIAGETVEQAAERAEAVKKPMLVLKFIEGHTCAVRRRVHMKDLLGPWVGF